LASATSSNQLQCRAVPPLHLIEQRNARGAGGEHDLRALDRGAALGVAGRLDGSDGDAETRLDRVTGRPHHIEFAAGDRHVGAFPR
jgi:hypothetical protein